MNDSTTIRYDPFAPAVQADPYPLYAALRREAPVHYVESLDAYAISRHADVGRVMHDHHTFSSEAMAALVLASLPTLLVFMFAQRVIMRGIILPSYK